MRVHGHRPEGRGKGERGGGDWNIRKQRWVGMLLSVNYFHLSPALILRNKFLLKRIHFIFATFLLVQILILIEKNPSHGVVLFARLHFSV